MSESKFKVGDFVQVVHIGGDFVPCRRQVLTVTPYAAGDLVDFLGRHKAKRDGYVYTLTGHGSFTYPEHCLRAFTEEVA